MIYESYKRSYYRMQTKVNEILNEKERLFNATQPKAMNYGTIQGGGKAVNSFDEYLVKCEDEEIDKRLMEAKRLLFEREKLMVMAEKELRESKDILDVVYRMAMIDNIKIRTIANRLCYSESQVYRFIEKIQKELRCKV